MSVLSAIKDFSNLKDISGVRAWFGVVNQVSWAYANAPTMQPFRDLVKPNTKFMLDATLDMLFEESMQKLISQCEEGIRKFDITKHTCLQTDWSRDRIGYLLLQKHCNCNMDKAPVCCKDGWQLVFAGSRFTQNREPVF